MIKYNEVQTGDILKLVAPGAPGYAELGDLVRVLEHTKNGVKVENKRGKTCEFVFNCGAERLEPTGWKKDFPADELVTVTEDKDATENTERAITLAALKKLIGHSTCYCNTCAALSREYGFLTGKLPKETICTNCGKPLSEHHKCCETYFCYPDKGYTFDYDQKTWWCCSADFGEHTPDCENHPDNKGQDRFKAKDDE